MSIQRKKIASKLRFYRKIHRLTGLITFIAFVFIGITGILLGWKKNSNGLILPKTQKGIANDASAFKSLNELSTLALNAVNTSSITYKINRLDVRPSKGIVKVTFKDSYKSVQIDATNGEILQIAMRNSDLIENIHDGSYIDDLLGFKSGVFKLVYTLITGLSLLLFSFTGFWLWYGPKLMRKKV